VAGVSRNTATSYEQWLKDMTASVSRPDPLEVQRYIASLRGRGLADSSVHKAFSVARTFFRWAVATGGIAQDPFKGFTMRLPKTLPHIPSDREIVAAVEHSGAGVVGLRNRVPILVMCDAGLRASEVIRLRMEHWDASALSLFVRSGKGSKDRVAFVGAPTAGAIRKYLAARQLAGPDDFLLVNDDGSPMTRRHLLQVLHRISERAGIPDNRRLHPHSLRHYAATSWLRNGVGLDEVRRLLGHESLSTTLRYSSLVSADLRESHKRAAAIERLGIPR
jgi:integrase/recombinase XerC